jgi:hypothetical protein
MANKKTMQVTFIDNCSHGYYSFSKKDIQILGIAEKISGYSGLTLNRVYLEEDCDYALAYYAAKEKGIELIIKESYNPNFKYRYNYNLSLFNWVPKLNDTIFVDKDEYKLTQILKNHFIIARNGIPYRVLKSNPFKYITSVGEQK